MLRGQTLKLTEDPHRRLNALTNEWVLVSPHRATRPWQGEVAQLPSAKEPTYDPTCYLCPGNSRVGGIQNPNYASTFVFENDFAALKPQVIPSRLDVDNLGLLVAESEPGICRVICFSPRHDLTLATMPLDQIKLVVDTWAGQFRELGGLPSINHVQIFENRGSMMGASNPHPHCQISGDSVDSRGTLERTRCPTCVLEVPYALSALRLHCVGSSPAGPHGL